MAHIIFDIDPMGAPRMTKSDTWKRRPVVVRYWAFKDAIRLISARHKYELGEALDVRFELPMPQGWRKKDKEAMRGKPHQQKPDVDNMAKAVMDAFKIDDSHVHTLKASKVWADKGRIIITITEVLP